MRTFMKRALLGALIGGGIVVVGAGVANAAETDGNDGLLSGTQGLIGIEVPVTVGGNGISLLGDASSSNTETAAPAAGAPSEGTTNGSDGVASGTQGIINVSIPVTVGGNAISVVGDSNAEDTETAAPAPEPAAEPAPAAEAPAAEAPVTDGQDGVASGAQAVVDAAIPVTVGGNAISVLGDSEATDTTTTGGTTGGAVEGTEGATTDGADSVAGGTQVVAPVDIPVTVGGNAISVLGDSNADGTTTTGGTTGDAAAEGTEGATTDGADGVLGGTQAVVDAAIPVTVGGNAISVLGDSEATDTTTTGGTTGGGAAAEGTEGATTDGTDSVAGGTQAVAPIDVPVTVGGNAISVLGDSDADGTTTTGGTTGGGAAEGTDGATTDGADGVLGGTQVLAPVDVPVTVGGNAISVIGDTEATDTTTTGGTTGGAAAEGTDGATTDGEDSVAGGTQVLAPVDVPVTIGGNAISVVGDSDADGTTTTGGSTGGGTGGITTGGDDGILGGTQLGLPISIPVTVGGNAISVIGDSETTDTNTVPTTPVDPTDPTDPTTPVDPTDPTDPVDPTDPGTTDPTTPGMNPGGTVPPAQSNAVGPTSVMAADTLAATGATDAGAFGLFAAALLLAGALLLVRTRTARNNS